MRKIAALAALMLVSVTSNVYAAETSVSQGKKEWTFLVYLNAFNSLDSFGPKDINEMEKVGSTDQINVVVQWASMTSGDVRRLIIKKDGDTTTVTSPVLENLGRVDMGDYRTLIDFVEWGAKQYPAKKYFVDVWNHGNGWHRNIKAGVNKDISYDDLSGHSIKTEQLGLAMREISSHLGQKVDVYGSDACMMGMIEVGAEMKDAVHVFVGSQEVEPGDGWPYDRLLNRWSANPAMGASEVGKILVEEYGASYPSDQTQITLSAFDLSKYATVAESMRDLTTQVESLPTDGQAKVIQASQSAQSFYLSDYVDLGDFLKNLDASEAISRGTVKTVRDALGGFLIANTVSADYARASGVSFWFPHYRSEYDSYSARYDALQFNRDTHWGDALAKLLPAGSK